MNKRLIPVVALCSCIILAIVYYLLTVKTESSYANAFSPAYKLEAPEQCCLLIANATGGFKGSKRVQSKETFLNSIESGFNFIEVDFAKTSDGQWVANTNWKKWRRITGYTEKGKPSLEAFKAQPYSIASDKDKEDLSLTPLSLDDIEELLVNHPDISIIVDTQGSMKELMETLLTRPIVSQVIMQVYRFRDIDLIRSKGFNNIIFSSARKEKAFKPRQMMMLLKRNKNNLMAANFSINYFKQHYEKLAKTEVPIYLRGRPKLINKESKLKRYASKGASGFFVDWYTPKP